MSYDDQHDQQLRPVPHRATKEGMRTSDYFTREEALQLQGIRVVATDSSLERRVVGWSNWRGPDDDEVFTLKIATPQSDQFSDVTKTEFLRNHELLNLSETAQQTFTNPGVKTMDNNDPVIIDVPDGMSVRSPSHAEYRKDEAEALQGMMVRSKNDLNAIGKVVGYHGYREGTPSNQNVSKVVYALDVTWTQTPTGYRNKENTAVFKNQIGKQFELLYGLRAKVAQREWVHHKMASLKSGQRPTGPKTGHRR